MNNIKKFIEWYKNEGNKDFEVSYKEILDKAIMENGIDEECCESNCFGVDEIESMNFSFINNILLPTDMILCTTYGIKDITNLSISSIYEEQTKVFMEIRIINQIDTTKTEIWSFIPDGEKFLFINFKLIDDGFQSDKVYFDNRSQEIEDSLRQEIHNAVINDIKEKLGEDFDGDNYDWI